MSRELRRVPENWEHPKNRDGKYESLSSDYSGSLVYWKEEVEKFIKHMTEVCETGKTNIYDRKYTSSKDVFEYFTEDGQMNPPDINGYMPNGKWYQLFQTVSEGTPLSPAFSTKEQLGEWLKNNPDYWGTKWSENQIKGLLEKNWLPSGIMTGGKFYKSEETAEL